ncbi:TetR/AcrR family transcriptional regulator [Microbispora sp. ATCC PTA-5024]|uniref:TetR/AcrR family transcriptional regulator n=1 Tax=Microbispora sp. ATCC PTA-5024 TaxID=316330 RepID=UPI000414FEA1|nr:TetR/AcrR family transcriptional regulator [Microbispora sp. ATCC PTA-5024]
MARKRPEARREEILTAAVAEVLERGLANVRVADVAARLDVSQALVFYHFETKERLVVEAVAHAAQQDLAQLTAVTARAASARERLRAALRLYAPSGTAPGWTLWIDGWAASLRMPELRRILREIDTRWREEITGLIAEGVRAREFRCDDPEGAAARIMAFLDGLSVQLVARQRSLTKKQAMAWLSGLVAAELGVPVEQMALA